MAARTGPLLLVVLLAPLAGCRTVVGPPETAPEPRAAYQQVANQLPRASFGWGEPPGIVAFAASVKRSKPGVLEPLKADERGFRIHFSTWQPGQAWIPYSALREVSYAWKPLPNVLLAPLLIVPLQGVRLTVVFDAGQVPGLLGQLEADARRLEQIAREVGSGGPYSFAQAIRGKVEDDAAEHGPGLLGLHFDYLVPVPAWLPVGGPARRAGEAFVWCREHPEEPRLEAPAEER